MDTLIPRRWQPLVVGSVVAGIAILIWINTGVEEGEEGGFVEGLIPIVIMFVATFLLWRFVVRPRLAADGVAAAAGTTALILGVVALLTGLAFWTGLVYAFAPAAIALGTAAAPDSKGRAAVVVGWLSLVVTLAIVISDQAN